ncbi:MULTISPECIES: sensor histidine kinase [Clostridium]|uniref:histidine kinase n=2 Tax=Clostridium TaxID=1485 RepID=A0ABX2TUA5_CLOLD|nr:MULTISPECIES: ATP-binding protein [Clostridium]AGY75071.1 ATP-binding protein [Clostridium autoethanogenum DSM 10061]ALU35244.1 Signal transduction histidine kinase regulating citrate/malate metabolism [Clostridium autoethanogenum DSM 10061]OAA87225.1 Sensor histidine kinase DcuS [Clostridium ljungdahlii DSM 13528]OVY49677.1 Sensor histidine kinase DcuS [Clostridium autoethanogenum]
MKIFESLCDEKKFIIQNKIKAGLFCILFTFVTYWSTFHVSASYHSLIPIIFDILLLSLTVKIRIFDSTIIVCLFITIIFTTEFLVQTIEMFVFNIDLNQIFLNSKYLWIFIIVSKVLQIFTVSMIFKFNLCFTKLKLFEKEGLIFDNLIIELGVFALFVFCINYGIFNIGNIQIYNIIIFSIYFVFLIAKFRSLKEKQTLVNINAKYKVQESQIKNMEEIISIIRQEKHDFANHINVIQGLCMLNKPNTVEKINDYVLKISDTVHSSFKYLDTGNDYIDGLLSIKNNYAMKNNIDFEVMIDEPFDLIKIRQDELISIISNLVDNAFEAFQSKSYTDYKEIAVSTFREHKDFCIEVADNGEVISENAKKKIFDKGFSTKTSKKSDHGFGLYIIKQLVEKNDGSICVESSPEITKFTIRFKIEG